MQYLSKLSIRSRLIFMLLAVSLGSILVIGILGWRNAQSALNQAITNQLTGVRASKAYQIESYFENIYSHTRTLAENRMIINAMKNFTVGYHEALERSLTPEDHQQVTEYYENTFSPPLEDNLDEPPLTIMYRPQRLAASYFQYHYIVNNSFPLGRKDEMTVAPEDTTTYNRFHSTYHPLLRNLRKEFGFYDLFFIEVETGNIVYSVFKQSDFATSLNEGPYRESGLGILVSQVCSAPERGSVTIVDYRPYDPSYGAPAAFVGAPIYDGNEVVGILALQLPVDEIDSVMTGGRNWQNDGLGETGETYLVGPDRLMRSISRSYLKDTEGYLDALEVAGFSTTTIGHIQSYETTTLLQPVNTDDSTSEAQVTQYYDRLGLEVEIVAFEDIVLLRQAYERGVCAGFTADKSGLMSQKLQLTEPAEHKILSQEMSRELLGPLVHHGDNNWHDVVSWVIQCTLNSEYLGVNQKNVSIMRGSEEPDIQRLLGETDELGAMLGLTNDFCYQVVAQVGNYADVYDRHLGPSTPFNLPRGLNALFTDDGILYPIPFK